MSPNDQPAVDFDEAWYLKRYTDVADAVRSGIIPDGLTHYLSYGRAERREAIPPSFRIVPYSCLATTCEIIFPSQDVRLASILQYSNVDRHNLTLGESIRNEVYSERTVDIPTINLYRLPVGTVLYGGYESLAGKYDYLFEEHVTVSIRRDHIRLSDNTNSKRPIVEISAPTLLATRYGVVTWGHWLIDILPKIVIAEKYFPRRFLFTLPEWVLGQGRWMESLAAYGIFRDRILPIRNDTNYVFAQISAISDIRYDDLIHPCASDCMDRCLSLADEQIPTQRTFLLRTDSLNRRISNAEDVTGLLEQMGFETRDPALISFPEQVQLFRRSASVASIIGSGLSGLIYSPPGVGIISFSPPEWADKTFYGMAQMKFGRYTEVRGNITRQDDRFAKRDSDFHVDLADLRDALSALSGITS